MSIKLFKQSLAKQIDIRPDVFISELGMEAFLIENKDILKLNDSSKVEIIKNQIFLKNARLTSKNSDGRLDLLISIEDDESKFLAIVELKKGILKDEHLFQLKEYLECFSENRSNLLSSLNIKQNLSDFTLIGILVGTNIDNNLKSKFLMGESHNLKNQNVEIFGITLNKFISDSLNELFIISENYTKSKSKFNRTRFDSWDEYLESNKIKNEAVIKILKILIARYAEDVSVYMNFTPDDISINTSDSSSKRKCFAYLKPQSKSVRVYVKLNSDVKKYNIEITQVIKNKEAVPNSFYFDIKREVDYLEAFELISESKLFIES